ncbi:MAG: prepilin peptidase [Bauldia sp.]
MATIGYLAFALFPLAMAFAALSDLFTMTISNRLSLALLAGFVILFPLTGADLNTLSMHLLSGGIVLAVTFACFALGWIGGGDAKFASAIALWVGWSHVFDFVLTSAIFGGVLTMVVLVFRKSIVLPASVSSPEWLERLHDSRSGVPYGIALAAAAMMIYPETIWMHIAAL